VRFNSKRQLSFCEPSVIPASKGAQTRERTWDYLGAVSAVSSQHVHLNSKRQLSACEPSPICKALLSEAASAGTGQLTTVPS
jgi:hypothetical protein